MALEIQQSETVELDTRMSWWRALFDWRSLLTLGLAAYFIRRGTRYTVTEDRVYRRFGLVSRAENTIAVDDVRDVQLRQSITGRLFGYGTVVVSTAGTGRTEIDFKGVGSPISVRDTLQATIS